jgi:chromosome segregation ATPase
MILAAGDSSNLPTVIAVIAALAAVGATVVTAFVALTNIKPTRRKTSAEAERVAAEVPFQGGSYIKELSEAASSLVTPLRNENEKLQQRVRELELRVNDLEKTRDEALRSLRIERDETEMTKLQYERRERDIIEAYEKQIVILRARVTALGGSLSDGTEVS